MLKCNSLKSHPLWDCSMISASTLWMVNWGHFWVIMSDKLLCLTFLGVPFTSFLAQSAHLNSQGFFKNSPILFLKSLLGS